MEEGRKSSRGNVYDEDEPYILALKDCIKIANTTTSIGEEPIKRFKSN